MSILVTGAAGFIGAEVARQLLASGETVVGIDSLNDYYDPALKQFRLEQLETSIRFTFEPIDIEDGAAVRALFERNAFTTVINLAARAGVRYSMQNPLVYMRTNAEGVLHLLEAMRHTGVKKLVQASTSSLYAGLPMPFVETHPVNTPISPYAASKKAAEVLAYTYHTQFGIDVSILRYFTVYGRAARPDMSPYRFAKWIMEGTPIKLFGDGEQARDFTHVEDIARGTILATKSLGYEIINLGGGNQPVTINEVIGWMEEDLGQQARVNYLPAQSADMKVTWANIERAKSLLGWEPTISPRDGIRDMTADKALFRFEISPH